jgi:hypothetical protein
MYSDAFTIASIMIRAPAERGDRGFSMKNGEHYGAGGKESPTIRHINT